MTKANVVASHFFECELDALGTKIPPDALLVVRQGDLEGWEGLAPLPVRVVMPGTLEHAGLLATQAGEDE